MRALVLIIALVATSASAKSNLPACQGSDFSRWSNCYDTYTWPSGSKYVGEWKDGMPHGQGTFTLTNGDKYVGEYKDGNRHGQGTYVFFTEGGGYVGEYKDNQRSGQGTYTLPNGDKYVGENLDGNRHGQGIYTFIDGSPPQEGIWENNKFVRAQRIPDHIAGRTSSAAPATNSSTIESASAKCEELGFKRGTEKFGECVLKISR